MGFIFIMIKVTNKKIELSEKRKQGEKESSLSKEDQIRPS